MRQPNCGLYITVKSQKKWKNNRGKYKKYNNSQSLWVDRMIKQQHIIKQKHKRRAIKRVDLRTIDLE